MSYAADQDTLNVWNHYSVGTGTAALWVGFGFSFFAAVVFIGISALSEKPKNALYNHLVTLIATIMALSYLVEALGQTEMFTVRPLLWIRYVQWVISNPLVIATLGLLAGASTTEIFYTVVLTILSVAALFAGAISSGFNATWPIFAFAVVAVLPVFYTVFGTWAARAATAPKATKAIYTFGSYFLAILTIGYFVNWGTAEGGKVQSIDQEIVTYTVLDILYRVVFGFVLLFVPNAVEGAAGFLEGVKTEEAAYPATVA